MEKFKMPRVVALSAIVGIGALGVTSCGTESTGQVNPPTIEEIREGGEYFELQRPDGSRMVCWSFGARGDGIYGESPSWFSVTCDWNGDYEGDVTTTTELQTINTLD